MHKGQSVFAYKKKNNIYVHVFLNACAAILLQSDGRGAWTAT